MLLGSCSTVARHGAGGGSPPPDPEKLEWESLSVISSHWIKVRFLIFLATYGPEMYINYTVSTLILYMQTLDSVTREIPSAEYSNATSEPNTSKNRYQNKIPCQHNIN